MGKAVPALLLILFTTGTWANELDRDVIRNEVFSPQQVLHASELPQTVIIRMRDSDPNDVEVAFVPASVPGERLAKLKPVFERLQSNKEVTGIALTPRNELDLTSSTQAWGFYPRFSIGIGFGFGPGYWGPPPMYSGCCGGYPGYAYANAGYPVYPTPYYARPYFGYAGYRYGYRPYWRWGGGPWHHMAYRWRR